MVLLHSQLCNDNNQVTQGIIFDFEMEIHVVHVKKTKSQIRWDEKMKIIISEQRSDESRLLFLKRE